MGVCFNCGKNTSFCADWRDNAAQGTAQTNSDEMIVNVSGIVGPFAYIPKY
jgi:hypothetical protein